MIVTKLKPKDSKKVREQLGELEDLDDQMSLLQLKKQEKKNMMFKGIRDILRKYNIENNTKKCENNRDAFLPIHTGIQVFTPRGSKEVVIRIAEE